MALVAVAVAVAVPFKIWLSQRSQLASLATQTKQSQQQVSALQAAHAKWQSPAYVEQQARERLHYVMPGQKTYVVLGKGSGTTARSVPAVPSSSAEPWYSQLWRSMQAAGAGRS